MSLVVAELVENLPADDRITVLEHVKSKVEEYGMQPYFQVRHNFSRISIQGRGGRSTAQAKREFEQALSLNGLGETTEDYVRDMTRELQQDSEIRDMIAPSTDEIERRIEEIETEIETEEQGLDEDIVPPLSPLPRGPLTPESTQREQTPATPETGARLGSAIRESALDELTTDDESETSTMSSYETGSERGETESENDATESESGDDDGDYYFDGDDNSYTISDTYDELQKEIDAAEVKYLMAEDETKRQRKIAEQLASAIATTSAFAKEDTLDESGNPRPISELMRMARVTSLWPVLSELQKSQFRDTPGVLAHDRHYIAKNILLAAPLKRKRPFVQTANGSIVFL